MRLRRRRATGLAQSGDRRASRNSAAEKNRAVGRAQLFAPPTARPSTIAAACDGLLLAVALLQRDVQGFIERRGVYAELLRLVAFGLDDEAQAAHVQRRQDRDAVRVRRVPRLAEEAVGAARFE